jgi:hypothetical protein
MELRSHLQSTIGRELTGGGMCGVFIAEHASRARKVVVRVLAPELGSAILKPKG